MNFSSHELPTAGPWPFGGQNNEASFTISAKTNHQQTSFPLLRGTERNVRCWIFFRLRCDREQGMFNEIRLKVCMSCVMTHELNGTSLSSQNDGPETFLRKYHRFTPRRRIILSPLEFYQFSSLSLGSFLLFRCILHSDFIDSNLHCSQTKQRPIDPPPFAVWIWRRTNDPVSLRTSSAEVLPTRTRALSPATSFLRPRKRIKLNWIPDCIQYPRKNPWYIQPYWHFLLRWLIWRTKLKDILDPLRLDMSQSRRLLWSQVIVDQYSIVIVVLGKSVLRFEWSDILEVQ